MLKSINSAFNIRTPKCPDSTRCKVHIHVHDVCTRMQCPILKVSKEVNIFEHCFIPMILLNLYAPDVNRTPYELQ